MTGPAGRDCSRRLNRHNPHRATAPTPFPDTTKPRKPGVLVCSRSGACPHRHSTHRCAARGASGGVGPPAKRIRRDHPRTNERAPFGTLFVRSRSGVVGATDQRSNNSGEILPPTHTQLQRLAHAARSLPTQPNTLIADESPRSLRRRLEPSIITEIVERYKRGEHTTQLCVEYGVSKGSVVKLLRDEKVQLRFQPLPEDKVEEAVKLYESGTAIAPIAKILEASFGSVRSSLKREGVQLRPRGGTYSVGRAASA